MKKEREETIKKAKAMVETVADLRKGYSLTTVNIAKLLHDAIEHIEDEEKEIELLRLKSSQFVELIAKQDSELCELRKYKARMESKNLNTTFRINMKPLQFDTDGFRRSMAVLADQLREINSKPPLGVMPRKIWLEKRLEVVREAIKRFVDANKFNETFSELCKEAHNLSVELSEK